MPYIIDRFYGFNAIKMVVCNFQMGSSACQINDLMFKGNISHPSEIFPVAYFIAESDVVSIWKMKVSQLIIRWF